MILKIKKESNFWLFAILYVHSYGNVYWFLHPLFEKLYKLQKLRDWSSYVAFGAMCSVVFSIFYTLLKLLLDTKMESSGGGIWQCLYSKKSKILFFSKFCYCNKEIKGHFHFTKQKRAAFESVVKVKERYLKRFWCDNHILIWGTFLMIYESEKAGFFSLTPRYVGSCR